ncbi:MAG: D-alanine--D-alanine ligase [Nitrospirae bacterium CG_4_9_14_3_um_filter_53_35]|nr:MAG: D-alanine--D-alanine ligase [Nitrospirae bacterium CG2_30_53_67]PIS37092.1 MAG: D-alanine--D-alanine ligase [Nitrospirae bacterium CG08_land_8_20_14_0_20_52_24]PIV84449.1 MAG: D-alanine--D-alanine ligase [Nitrospirae bacterium CG17_big_fil_post_rev_8_21_14_2_50_50_9]PIW84279.1 MAG: D-alanine--D-alanine ligase [Nitrospirae bacterium CG_4_8_14_3_um_filter_50_41]PJA76594.1 MAG: D-alanine--D-alanine ligase [Nitrospirae bacterium CG_4_9_14_3_um_filter_53_35]
MKIGVLMGGLSSEREISLRSGKAVFEALKRKGYDAVCIDPAPDLGLILQRRKVDAAFICLHGTPGEDGTVQGLLEFMGIPYTGSGVLASAAAMDKIVTKKLLIYHAIPTPDFSVNEHGRTTGKRIALPVIVKPATEGSTIGVSRVSVKKDLEKAIRIARRFGPKVLIEKFIQGRELTVGILNDLPLPVVEIRPMSGFYDFKSKYTPGRTEYRVPAPLLRRVSKRVQELALSAHRALGCNGASRVDFMLADGDDPYVLEVNTIPGMTETSLLPKAAREAGISFDDLVERILTAAVRG